MTAPAAAPYPAPRHAAICGLGAVGTLLAARILPRLARGESLCAILDAPRLPRYRARPPTFNGRPLDIPLATPADAAARPPVDLLFVAVKNPDLPAVPALVRPFLAENARIVPLLNGIDAPPFLALAFSKTAVFHSLIFCDSSMRTGRDVTQNGALGIRLGRPATRGAGVSPAKPPPDALAVANWLNAHDVPATVPENILAALWRKFLLNVALNQTEALFRLPHGPLRDSPEAYAFLLRLLDEALAVARAENIPGADTLRDPVLRDIAALAPDGKSSMLQDIEAGRPTEVAAFAGAILRLARKHTLPAPASETVLARLAPR